MKIPCAVVRDLLPLYAEKMVKKETEMLIDEHLAECAECRRLSAETVSSPSVPVETAKPLQTLKKQIGRRHWRTALLAGLCVFIAAFTYVFHAYGARPLPWKEGLVTVQGVQTVSPDDGSLAPEGTEGLPEAGAQMLILSMDGSISAMETEVIEGDNGTTTAVLQGFGRSDNIGRSAGTRGEMKLFPVPDRVVYGYTEPQAVLRGELLNEGVAVLPRLALAYYLWIAAALAAITGVLWLVFHGGRLGAPMRRVFFLPVSYIVAHLLLKGTNTTSYFLMSDVRGILLAAAALYGVFSIVGQFYLERA